MAQSLPEIRDLVDSRIDRFVIKAKLGSGGMGEVFLVEDTLLKRLVAIKAIRSDHTDDPSFRRRLVCEAERASQLNDERIARIYDVLEHEHGTFLVMEYVEGQTLRARLGKPLPIDEFFRLAEQCLTGVAAAHDCGILHCDLKPENIMITPAGQIKILDFGFACHAPGSETQDSVDLSPTPLGGTLRYMAPEVLMGDPPHKSADIFSLGVILYEALTGLHPFRAEGPLRTAGRVMHDEPGPIGGTVLAGLDAVILRMLAKNPAERYQDCADVLADIRGVRDGRAPVPTAQEKPRTTPHWGATVIAVVAVLVVLFFSWLSPPPAPPPVARLLAVLPFEPTNANDVATRALANGLTATLTAQLGELADRYRLQIVPAADLRTQHAADPREARNLLGATLALAGTLEPSGDTLRVTYSLIDTASLRQLRSGVITEDASKIFDLQNHVLGEVLNSLDIELAADDLPRMKTHGTAQARAYDSYLRGYGYLHAYDRPENLDNAIAAFQTSLYADPSFALAYAGLGQAYLYKKIYTPEDIAQAGRACTRAVELDKMAADGEICLGMFFNSTGQYELAGQHLERAVKLDDRRIESWRELGQAYERLKRLVDAEAAFKRSISIQPQYWAGYKRLGKFYYDHGRNDEAVERFKEVVRLAPGNFSNYTNLGGVYVIEGRYAQAIPVLEQSIAIRRTYQALTNLGVAYFYEGRFQIAARTYEDAIKLNPNYYGTFGNLAEASAQISGKRQQSNSGYMQALKLAEQTLDVNAKDAVALSYAALYAARLGLHTKADEYRQRSLTLSSAEPHIRENSALVLAEFHQDDGALAELDQAVSEGLQVFEITHQPAWQRFTAYPRYSAIIARAESK
jgi:eukaryotic-like serine/threonine-protein kinase